MSSTRPICLVRGSINLDEFYHVPHIVFPGQTISATSLTRRLGGKGGNQAKAAACAGAYVVMDGTVGDDGEGRAAVEELCSVEKGGGAIGKERLRFWKEGVTGKAIIQLSADGENSIIILPGANFANLPPPSPLIPETTTHLLLANEIPFESTLQYLQAAHSSNVITIWNPSPMPTVDQLRHVPWESLDWLLVNEGELEEIVRGLRGESETQSRDVESLAISLDARLGKSVNIACTLGSSGIFVSHRVGSSSLQIIRAPCGKLSAPVKDTTGAGDCFAGTFVAGLMRMKVEGEETSERLKQVVEECMTACAMCVEKEGAQDSYSIREEVLKRI